MTIYEHTAPTVLIVLGILAALGVGAVSLWRFMPRNAGNLALSGLYVAFLLLLTWCLLMPGRKDVETHLLKPRFVVALDTSSSMLFRPSEDVSNRWTMARQALDMPWTDVVGANCEVEVFGFAAEVGEEIPLAEVGELTAEGGATLLRDCLKQIGGRYAGLNVAGALLLSDGIDTREAFDDWATDSRPFPFFTVRLEPETEWEEEADIRINSVSTPRRVTVDWKSEIKTVVSGQGTKGATINVQLFENDVLRDEQPTQFPAEGGSREVMFELDHPETGIFTYRICVPPLPNESNTNDNEYVLSVQVVDTKNRLLYVEGAPRWEYKFLKRVLVANRQATSVIFFTGHDGKPQGVGPLGSMTADMTGLQLAFFKIVVLGNLDARELTERRAQNLVKFVDTGGSLVLLGGAKAWGADGFVKTSLRKVMPAKDYAKESIEGEAPFPVQLTDTGRSHPVFAGDPGLWDIVPPVLSVYPDVALSPGARALVSVSTPQGTQPIVVSHRYGQGKVVAVFTDSLWKWQLTPESIESKPYQRFWTQLISWLLPSEQDLGKQEIDIFADRERLFMGEEVEINARIGGEEEAVSTTLECLMILPDKREMPYAMRPQHVVTPSGRTFPGFAMTFKAAQPGLHTATAVTRIGNRTVKSDPISFFVQPYTPESMPRPINVAVLEGIASSSKARFFESLEEMNNWLSGLNPNPIEEETAQYRTLWRRWPMVILLMLLLSVTWGARKLRNMP